MGIEKLVTDAFIKADMATDKLLAVWNDDSNAPIRKLLAGLAVSGLARINVSVGGNTNVPKLRISLQQIDKFVDVSIGRKTPLTPLGDLEITMALEKNEAHYTLRNNVTKSTTSASTHLLYAKLWSTLPDFRAADLVLPALHKALRQEISADLPELQSAFETAATPRKQLLELWHSAANTGFRELVAAVESLDDVQVKVDVGEDLTAPWMEIRLSRAEKGAETPQTLLVSIGPGGREHQNYNMNFIPRSASCLVNATSPYEAHARLWSQLSHFRDSGNFLPALHHALKAA